MSALKEKFIKYCEGKIKNLGEATYIDYDGEEVTANVAMEADIREFSNLRVLLSNDYDDDTLLAIDRHNKIRINSPMLSIIYYTIRMEFTSIDIDFYYNILEYWEAMGLDDEDL